MNNKQPLWILLLVLCLTVNPALAGTDNELTSWQTLTVDLPVTDKVFIREAFSTRQIETFTEADITLVRSSINYEFNPDLIVSAAYDWFKIYNRDANYENRLWQQIYYRHDTSLENLRLFHRIRVDERLVDNADTQVRLRYMAALEYSLSDDLTLVVSDEFMLNTRNNEKAEAGIDQNRIAIGLSKQFNDIVTGSLSYQFQHFFDDRDLINHGLLLGVMLNFR